MHFDAIQPAKRALTLTLQPAIAHNRALRVHHQRVHRLGELQRDAAMPEVLNSQKRAIGADAADNAKIDAAV